MLSKVNFTKNHLSRIEISTRFFKILWRKELCPLNLIPETTSGSYTVGMDWKFVRSGGVSDERSALGLWFVLIAHLSASIWKPLTEKKNVTHMMILICIFKFEIYLNKYSRVDPLLPELHGPFGHIHYHPVIPSAFNRARSVLVWLWCGVSCGMNRLTIWLIEYPD